MYYKKYLYPLSYYLLKIVPIIVSCVCFDYMLKNNIWKRFNITEESQRNLHALTDSIGHGSIATVTWLVVIDYRFTVRNVLKLMLCGIFGSLIDVDHFIHARSLDIKDALSLPTRPPFHNTSIIILFFCVLIITRYIKQLVFMNGICFLIITALLTHHLRDANRRGLWLWPVTTKPFAPDFIYITLVCVVPIFIWSLKRWLDDSSITVHSQTSMLV